MTTFKRGKKYIKACERNKKLIIGFGDLVSQTNCYLLWNQGRENGSLTDGTQALLMDSSNNTDTR